MTTEKTKRFISKAVEIANDPASGYSQIRRWGKDYDCSSLMYTCGYYAGYELPNRDPRYTGTMVNDFRHAGFTVHAFDGNLFDLEPGDILLNEAHHTAVYIGDGKLVEASIAETGGIDGMPGDQTGHEIHVTSVYNWPWTHVLTPPREGADMDEKELARLVKEAIMNAKLPNPAAPGKEIPFWEAVVWTYAMLKGMQK